MINLMNHLISDSNNLMWFCFTVYVLTVVFLIPNPIQFNSKNIDVADRQALQFASRFILRIALVIPIIFLLKNAI